MLKKFTEGLAFGGGFGISFIALWYLTAYIIYPMYLGPQMNESISRELSNIKPNISHESPKPETPFHELDLEEQIKRSSVIALARYEASSDGKMKAIIKEFIKKVPGTSIYYNVGDEYKSSSYYPKENTNYGDGIVIFFTGSPAMMRLSITFHGDRIHGLGDLPLELLRNKCKEDNA